MRRFSVLLALATAGAAFGAATVVSGGAASASAPIAAAESPGVTDVYRSGTTILMRGGSGASDITWGSGMGLGRIFDRVGYLRARRGCVQDDIGWETPKPDPHALSCGDQTTWNKIIAFLGGGNDEIGGLTTKQLYAYGDAGDDVLRGSGLNDHLSGGSGNDELHGGRGADTLNCGSGRDVAYTGRGDRWYGCEVILPDRSG